MNLLRNRSSCLWIHCSRCTNWDVSSNCASSAPSSPKALGCWLTWRFRSNLTWGVVGKWQNLRDAGPSTYFRSEDTKEKQPTTHGLEKLGNGVESLICGIVIWNRSEVTVPESIFPLPSWAWAWSPSGNLSIILSGEANLSSLALDPFFH